MTTRRRYAVFQDIGMFSLYEPTDDGQFVRNVMPPAGIDGHDAERAWFMNWCDENGIDPVFDN